MNLILIGYRGSGKSTLARLLAEKEGWNCLDTDFLIEQRIGHSIAEIFRTSGEAYFRKIEADIIESLPSRIQAATNTVIATGGGAVLLEKNRNILKSLGQIVWLTAKNEILAKRIGESQNQSQVRRPLLAGKSILEEIEILLPKRESAYSGLADFSVDTSSMNVDAAVAAVLATVVTDN